jgi:uncharacterized delta-60 repeat protein
MPLPFTRRITFFLLATLLTLASSHSHAQGPTVDPTFQPARIFAQNASGAKIPGVVNDVVRQPDGKYIIGGSFTEVNGVPALNLARLNADGTTDLAYTTACQANGPVLSLALQPDGRLIVGGQFTALAGTSRVVVGRLMTNGTIDAAFAPPSLPIGSTTQVKQIALQSTGKILLVGSFNLRDAAASPQSFARLEATTGQEDLSFQYVSLPSTSTISVVLVRPDNKIIVGLDNRVTYTSPIIRLLPDGTTDASFSPPGEYSPASVFALTTDVAGRIYVSCFQYGGFILRRFSPDGGSSQDQTFQYTSPYYVYRYYGYSLAVQPNGRLLLGADDTDVTSTNIIGSLGRVLDNGKLDPSFISASGPSKGKILRLLVQPDGAIIAAGSFQQVGTNTGINGIVRLLDTNVLRVASAETAARTAAWPVPAHDELHLQLEAKARPQHVSLINALGKVVHSQAVTQPELTISTAALAAGVYMLQVHYAEGMVTRRIAVQ